MGQILMAYKDTVQLKCFGMKRLGVWTAKTICKKLCKMSGH